jgi:hypothetical protein
MEDVMNPIAALGLALALTSVAAAPAAAFDFSTVRGAPALELQRADVCTFNEAMGTLRRAGYKEVADLPAVPGSPWRFIVFAPSPDGYGGLNVDASTCALQFVADIAMKRPWCEYHPVISHRCPTAFTSR